MHAQYHANTQCAYEIPSLVHRFIFLMRNSYRQVSFLHVYHHSSITIVVAMYAHFDTSGDVYLPVMLNSIVHVIMYGYYFCGAAGFKFQLALRPHITKMQLTQFLIIASQAFMVWSHGGSNPITMKKAKTKSKSKSKSKKQKTILPALATMCWWILWWGAPPLFLARCAHTIYSNRLPATFQLC